MKDKLKAFMVHPFGNLTIDVILFMIGFALLGRLANYYTWASISMDSICSILALAVVGGLVNMIRNMIKNWGK